MTGFYFDNKNSGSFLIFRPQKEDELDAFTLGMVSNNCIPGLLPIRFVQMNNERQFMYNVTAKVSLKQYMAGSVTKNRCIDILRGIAGTALSINEFMLDYSSLILDAEYIFLDVSTGELQMVCLPIVRERQNHDMRAYFRQMISSMVFFEEENMEYPAQILNALNGKDSRTNQTGTGTGRRRRNREETHLSDNNFLLKHFMKQLEVIRGEEVEKPPKAPVVAIHSQHHKQPGEHVNSIGEPGHFSDSELFDFGITDSLEYPATETEHEEESRQTGRVKGISAFFRRIRNLWEPKEETGLGDTGDFLQKFQPFRQGVSDFGEPTFLGDEQEDRATMLLSELESIKSSHPTAYLLRKKNDETIEILGDTFKIGKEKQYVDYCIEDNPTVSRSHADIIRKENGFYIIDNNSTNHTCLDGVVIPNCKQIELRDGSKIALGNELFTFYCRDS